MTSLDLSRLARFEPISTLSPDRLEELAGLCFVERVSKDMDPLRMNVTKSPQSFYLLKGNLGLRFQNGRKVILRGGSKASNYPVNDDKGSLKYTVALTDIEILRIDQDLLDIMMTWDQLAGYESSDAQDARAPDTQLKRDTAGWMRKTSVFSAENLQNGVFSRLPYANIEEMFRRMTVVEVQAGQVIITQGAQGDFYYLIEQGTAIVSRTKIVSEPPVTLAELGAGSAFGEEALVSDNKRNATVTMKTDGRLLRLNKDDFIELLKAPLLQYVDMEKAKQMVEEGAVWLDVRFPSEFVFEHLADSVNTPLHEIRGILGSLDQAKQYITYCQTGRRSSAAAFILIQHGFNAVVLEGGTRGSRRFARAAP
ncbi:Cyclic nucleotide-gated potassium channel [Methylophilaceae bacterium]|nr:Cyclic nucleotide-gated potassium channel [Methylophilaceae bacterium]